MKGFYFFLFLLLAVGMALSPLQAIHPTDNETPTQKNCFLVKDIDSAEILEVEEREYVIGVLAGEMSPDTETEALKAQAVAAYTYAVQARNTRIQTGGEYDVTSSPTNDQCYLSTSKQVALWQDDYSKNRELLEAAVDAVSGLIITYEGEPILAAYHGVSAGKTESAANVWGGDYPYLTAVESACDLLSPEYLSNKKYDLEEFALLSLELGVTLVGESSSWLSEPTRSESGTVLEYTLGGAVFSGSQMRSAFSLASANFDLEYSEGYFTFTVRGSGHGVGMSQFGASYLAKQGAKYSEILAVYYPGTSLSNTYN